MTDKVKTMAPLIWEEIKKSKNILLHCHPSPDPDSVGSALAMMHILNALGKKVTVILGDSTPPSSLKVLPGSEKIEQINFFQVDLSKFDTFIILDTSSPEQVSKKGPVVFPDSLNTIIIDHHKSNKEFAKTNLVDVNYPATCQIIYDLLKEWKLEITPDTALCLFTGIYTDTGGFQYKPADSSTFLAAAELVKINPDFSQAIFELENNNEPGQILYKGLALSSIELYFNKQLAMSAVPYEELQKKGIKTSDTEKAEISNTLKSVIGWEIGCAFSETEKSRINISLRTRGKYDVAKIASALPGGGGHFAAAGATLFMPYEEAKKLFLDTVQKIYPELGKL